MYRKREPEITVLIEEIKKAGGKLNLRSAGFDWWEVLQLFKNKRSTFAKTFRFERNGAWPYLSLLTLTWNESRYVRALQDGKWHPLASIRNDTWFSSREEFSIRKALLEKGEIQVKEGRRGVSEVKLVVPLTLAEAKAVLEP